MDVKSCSTCFYSELYGGIHPCVDCFNLDKWVKRDLYIKDASQTLTEAIKEWVDVKEEADVVNQPAHYTEHPSGIECIQITEHMGFNLGNAIKYIWRCDLKRDAIEDLKKAKWYIDREIDRREHRNI
jgi:hypothetical protein